jgi:hypothetical protein
VYEEESSHYATTGDLRKRNKAPAVDDEMQRKAARRQIALQRKNRLQKSRYSEKPDSNQRPIELQSIALPLSYPRLRFQTLYFS